jgi:hypothetical protein
MTLRLPLLWCGVALVGSACALSPGIDPPFRDGDSGTGSDIGDMGSGTGGASAASGGQGPGDLCPEIPDSCGTDLGGAAGAGGAGGQPSSREDSP